MHKTIDPWGSVLVEDYNKIIRDFGLEPFEQIFPQPNQIMRRGAVFAGRGLKQIAACIKQKKPFYVLSGIMPSGDKLHFGNKMVVENVKYFQDHGAETYMLIADLEAAAARGVSLEQARQRALDFHVPAYIALGLDPKKTKFYFQSENIDVVRLGYEFSKRITYNEFKAIYGSADPGRIMSAVTQVGDILFPQLKKPMPGVIPVGIDQDPHLRLARDIVKRTRDKYRFVPPAGIYHKYTPSLDGALKMSKSKPESCISLPEDPKQACKKIQRALSGGRDTVEEHRKLGGQPEKDMAFELCKLHLVESDAELNRIYKAYKSGKMLSGELKEIACERMTAFMEDFTKKLEKAKKQVSHLRFLTFA